MKPTIAKASRGKCLGCGSGVFIKKQFKDFENQMPVCVTCNSWPDYFRVIFSIPKIGEEGFKKLSREMDQKGRKLDSPSKADAFCDFLKDKLKLEGNEFDPREIGTKEEQDQFKLGINCKKYIDYQVKRVREGELTPGGFRNIEKSFRLYIIPMLGNKSVKDINFQLVNSIMRSEFVSYKNQKGVEEKLKITKNVKTESLKYLKTYFEWCVEEGLLKSVPLLPKKPKYNKSDPKKLYTIDQRNMVIANIIQANCKLKNNEKQKIRYRKIQIALMISAAYTKRTGEIESLKWGNFNFKKREVSFVDHISNADAFLKYTGEKEKGKTNRVAIEGLKSAKEAELVYNFFDGLYELLMELGPSLNQGKLLFDNGKGEPLAKDAIYNAWRASAMDLVHRGRLPYYVDVHRGIRTSTITALKKKGYGSDTVAELHGGDKRTVEEFYIRKDKQIVGDDVLKETSSFLQ